MFEREWRDLAWVPRWAIIRTNRTQSVAEHSFFVSVYAFQIGKELKGLEFGQACAVVALYHDFEESWMSDIPGPVKRSIRDDDKFREYVSKGVEERLAWSPGDTEEIAVVLKVANLLDEVLFQIDEERMGNSAIRNSINSSSQRLYRALYRMHDVFNSTPQTKVIFNNYVDEAISLAKKGYSSGAPTNNTDL